MRQKHSSGDSTVCKLNERIGIFISTKFQVNGVYIAAFHFHINMVGGTQQKCLTLNEFYVAVDNPDENISKNSMKQKIRHRIMNCLSMFRPKKKNLQLLQ